MRLDGWEQLLCVASVLAGLSEARGTVLYRQSAMLLAVTYLLYVVVVGSGLLICFSACRGFDGCLGRHVPF